MTRRFPNLDLLRFYAALSVVVYHIEYNPPYWTSQPVHHSLIGVPLLFGADAVTLFFVLSGFLITHLLITEKRDTRTVDVKAFYKRRVLRIWPLYYTLVFVVMVILPLLGTPSGITPVHQLLILTFLPSVSFALGQAGALSHFWSIGVEEQFYLVWPWLVKFTGHLTAMLLIVLIGKLLLNGLVWQINLVQPSRAADLLLNLLYQTRFESMAIGGLGAVIIHRYPLLRHLIQRRSIGLVASILFARIAFWPDTVDVPIVTVSSIFALLITHLATSPRPIWRIDSAVTRALGNMSYAIYLIHPFVLDFVWHKVSPATFDTLAGQVFLYASVIGITLTLAYASYRWLEAPFLRLKDRRIPLQSRWWHFRPKTIST